MKSILLLFCLTLNTLFFGQSTPDFSNVDAKMDEIPASLTQSTSDIAQYIAQHFNAVDDKVRAAFYWTASSISYDVEIMTQLPQNLTPQDKIESALKTRKGVCMHYAEVFASLTNQLGIPTVLVDGYTKNNGKIDALSHVWCAVKIDDKWTLHDPTWGAGFVNNLKFYKKLNNFYYNTDPNELIKNHMPFDFIWQLKEYPISHEEFYDGINESVDTSVSFDFNGAIEAHQKSSKIEQTIGFSNRIKKRGLKNKIIIDRVEILEKEIEFYNQKQKGVVFMSIADTVQLTAKGYNDFIQYRNKKFSPPVSDDDLRAKIQILADQINQCETDVNALKDIGKENIQNLNALKNGISDLKKRIEEQKLFVLDYLSKDQVERPKMFVRVVKKR